MLLLISDANILIDLEEGGLTAQAFRLPYRLGVPDILFHEELAGQHAHLLEQGLSPLPLAPDSLIYAQTLIQRARGPSRNDCFALALAHQEACPLLSGDRDLRRLARSEGLEIRGTLWLVEEMVRHRLISTAQAQNSYDKMQAAGRRLPWAEAGRRLREL